MITSQALDEIAQQLRRLVADLEDAAPHGRPNRPWSPVRVDTVRRRAAVLIDQILDALPDEDGVHRLPRVARSASGVHE